MKHATETGGTAEIGEAPCVAEKVAAPVAVAASAIVPITATAEDYVRGTRFAGWLQDALQRKNWRPKHLSDESVRSGRKRINCGHICVLIKGGFNPVTGKVICPTSELIERIAEMTGADKQTGLQSAGFWPPPSPLSDSAVRYILIPQDCPPETEQVLRETLQSMANRDRRAKETEDVDPI